VDYGVDDGGAIPPHDLLVLLDGSELSRTGRLADRFEAAPSRKLVIDHHILPPDRWWDACFHDVTASATGVLVARIADALGVKLDEVAAQGVFTSIVTDTGWFKYSNTDAETLSVAGHLVQRGVDIAGQFMDLNQRRPEDHPVELGRLLARTEYFAGGRVALLTLPLGTDGRVPEMDTDDALDVVRSVDGVEVVLFVREIHPGLCKLSARSKTTFDVASLARTFGGGGHRKASGATLEGELADAARRVVQLAVQQLGS
jgi:phosphoesterase RecJ-like protein